MYVCIIMCVCIATLESVPVIIASDDEKDDEQLEVIKEESSDEDGVDAEQELQIEAKVCVC